MKEMDNYANIYEHKLKTKDIIKINMYLNTIPTKEIDENWENDKIRTDYFDFPVKNHKISYKKSCIDYVEDNIPELKLFFIQDIRNIVFKYIRKIFEFDVFSINLKDVNVNRGIFFIDADTFHISDYYQILNEKTGNLSNKYIYANIVIQKEPLPWCDSVEFELVRIIDNEAIKIKRR